ELERFDEAESVLHEAERATTDRDDASLRAEHLGARGNIERGRGHVREAIEAHERAVHVLTATTESRALDRAAALYLLGEDYLAAADPARALSSDERGLALIESALPRSATVATLLTAIGEAQLLQHAPDRALDPLQRAHAILESDAYAPLD